MPLDDLTVNEAHDCVELLALLEAALRQTLTTCTPEDEAPRFARMLDISALLRLASQLMREALDEQPDDRDRFVAMVGEVLRRMGPPASERTH